MTILPLTVLKTICRLAIHSKDDAISIALSSRSLLQVANAYLWFHITLRDDETTSQRILFLTSHRHLVPFIKNITIEWPASDVLRTWKTQIGRTATSVRAVACVAMEICPETIQVICPIIPYDSALTFIGCVVGPQALMSMVRVLTQPASLQFILSVFDIQPLVPLPEFTSLHHLGLIACGDNFWTSSFGGLLLQQPLNTLVYSPNSSTIIPISLRWRRSLTEFVINLQNYTPEQLAEFNLPSFEHLRLLRVRCDDRMVRDLASITGRVPSLLVLDVQCYVYDVDRELWGHAISSWASIQTLRISIGVSTLGFRYSPPLVGPLRVFLTQTVRGVRPLPAVTCIAVQHGDLPPFDD